MKKIVFTCFTHYQLIMAIQLKLTEFRNDEVSLLVADTSKNADVIINNINKSNVFKTCKLLYAKELEEKKHSISEIFMATFGTENNIKRLFNCSGEKYDVFLYFNNNITNNCLFAYFAKINPHIFCYGYEEGITTYDVFDAQLNVKNNFKRVQAFEYIQRIFCKPTLSKSTKRFYCLHPEFYRGKLEVKSIETINSKEVTQILSKVFNLDANKERYTEKYIFFSGTYDFEGGQPIGELKLIRQIATLVGKENLLIKLHPRDFRDYEGMKEEGFHFDENSMIPWEVIQLNYGFRNHIFLTILSNSILIANSMVENPVKSYYLYDICENTDNNICAKTGKQALETLREYESITNIFTNIFVAKNLKEIIDYNN